MLPIPESNPNSMSINNVPPATGSVLCSEESYTPFIPRYPAKRSTNERDREIRGPIESASLPRNGDDAYTPTIMESQSARCVGDRSMQGYSFHLGRPNSVLNVTIEGDDQAAVHTLRETTLHSPTLRHSVGETYQNKPGSFEHFQLVPVFLTSGVRSHT